MKITIGTRGSALALWQANWVKGKLEKAHTGISVDLALIKTKGDIILDTTLSKVGGKGLFVKEIEEALLRKRVDLAVHSMKDMPAVLPDGLTIAAVPEREDCRDVLICKNSPSLEGLPKGATVGTSSLRRQSQILRLRPDLRIVPLRGNVDTRIRKLRENNLDAVVLAAAGIKRMKQEHVVSEYLDPDTVLPAIGQGTLAIETREDNKEIRELVGFLNHRVSRIATQAERSFLRTLEGGCQVPIAGLARVENERVRLTGMVADIEGTRVFKESMNMKSEHADTLGKNLATTLLRRGAKEVLDMLMGIAS